MAIRLHGMTYSNYYNMVKAVMLEQGMDFEEVLVKPNQEPDYLRKSPMGKVPCIESEEGFLTETSVILDFLHETRPDAAPSLYPASPFRRAKVRELIHHLELYVELPARRLYGEVFFGRPASDELRQEVRGQLEKGFAALLRLGKFEPYIAGRDISYADFFFRFSVGLATIVTKKGLGWDAFNDIAALRPLLQLMDQRDSIRSVLSDQRAAS